MAAAKLHATLDQMDRGPARAFHQRGAGARPVLVARHRGRCRRRGCSASAASCSTISAPTRCRTSTFPTIRPSMMSGPYMLPALAIDVTVAATNKTPVSSVRGAGYPQAAFAMERLMDRVARELGLDRAEAAPPQSHPAGKDALHQAAEGALRRRHAIRQRRLSGVPGARCSRPPRWDDFPAASSRRRARKRPLSRHRAGARHQGHRARAVRVRPGAGVEHRPRVGVHRRRRDRAGARHRAGADLRRRARPARGRDHRRVRRHRRRVARARRLRQPPDRDGRLVGSACGARGRRQGEEAREPRARSGRARPRDCRRRGARGRRAAALRSSSASWRAFSRARPATAFRPTSSPASKPTSIGAPMRSPTPMPATSPRSRSIPTPAASGFSNYVALQDSGVLINPMMVDGQVRGGIAHGIGNALLEWMGFDDSGQPVTTTFADYLLPGAMEVPDDRDALPGDAVAAQSARRQGRGRGQHHPDRRGGDLGHRGCAAALRRAHRADAGHAGEAGRARQCAGR